MSLFGLTVRDFSKSQEGRGNLQELFIYNAIPRPNLTRVSSDRVFDKNILGRAVEYLLQLLIERQNQNFEFGFPLKRHFGDSRTKEAKEIKKYFASGELTDRLLGCLISLGKKRQKAFQRVPSKSKRDDKDGLKAELRRIHQLGSVLKWNVKDSFYQGWLTDGRVVTAQADLIIDTSLLEVKTVEDARKHDEHLSQLFCYFLLSQAPMRKSGAFKIDELGIYYARHGVLVKQSIPALVQFPLSRVTKIAFDFAVKFSQWRTRKELQQEDNNYAMWQIVQELYPRPAWVAKIVERHRKKMQENFFSRKPMRIPKVILPKNFLLGGLVETGSSRLGQPENSLPHGGWKLSPNLAS